MKTIFDCDDDFQPPPILSCLSQLDSGEIVATANMASFGDLVVGPCGPPGEFPAFCNKSIPNEKEYPYCQFESQSDGTVCAKNGETLEFVDTDGDTQSCECKYTSIAVGPQAACKLVASASDAPVMSPTVVPERPPTSAPFERTTVDNRDSAASHLGVAVSWMSAASLFVVGVLAAFC
uniref:Uncharacterized protein n=2 Tax=Craspedostauros australis TaxID=1486917 RepID=A0A7R9WR92_9STRA